MDSSANALTELQRLLLEALAGAAEFFLTGGAAAGIYLNHRLSLDLDLFVMIASELDRLAQTLIAICNTRRWHVEEIQKYPSFRRCRIFTARESTLVDMVHEVVSQIVSFEDKPFYRGIRLDSKADIVANKLCSILGRSEIKDIVDLYFFALDGCDPLAFMNAAAAKEAGMEPATLAYVLQSAALDVGALALVRPFDPVAFERFRDELVRRLLAYSWPGGPASQTTKTPWK